MRPADVVNLPDFALLENRENAKAVILDVQPISLLLAVAINGERPVAEGIGDHEGHKFFWKLIRAVIVGRSRDHRGKLVSSDVRPNQEIRSRLRRGVRTARLQGEAFVSEHVWRNVAID